MNYQLKVKTNCYSGNFEREMCAYMTGITGEEDNTGEEYVEDEIKERFENLIAKKSDDYGEFRPVTVDNDDANDFTIFLEEKLNEEDLKFLEERAKLWEQERPYEYLDKNFKFLGIEQYSVEIKKIKI